MPAGIAVIEFLLLDALFFEYESRAAAFLELLDDLLLFTCRKQFVARAIERNAALGDDLDLRDDTTVEKLQVCVDALQLARVELLVLVAQHRCVAPELVVEARQLGFGFVEGTLTHRNDKLFLILDALSVIEHRLQNKAELLHVTLISFTSVCS
jgi:hypothetical protein